MSKCKIICIKCKVGDVMPFGNGRLYNICPKCYKKQKLSVGKSFKVKKHKKGKYWQDEDYRKKKMKFRKDALNLMGRTCMRCFITSRDRPIEIDHVLPTSYFPHLEFDMKNIQVLCKPCNYSKLNKDTTDYRTEIDKQKCYEYGTKLNLVRVKPPNRRKIILRKKAAAPLASESKLSRHL